MNLVDSNFKCTWETWAVPLLSFYLFTVLMVRHWKWWWALWNQVAFAGSHCSSSCFPMKPPWVPSPACHGAELCIPGQQLERWQLSRTHGQMCVHGCICICNRMGRSKLWTAFFKMCWACLEPGWGQAFSVTFLRVWGKTSEGLLWGVTKGHHDTVI